MSDRGNHQIRNLDRTVTTSCLFSTYRSGRRIGLRSRDAQVAIGLLAPSSAAFSCATSSNTIPTWMLRWPGLSPAELNTRTIRTSDGKMYSWGLPRYCRRFAGQLPQGADEHAFPLYSLQDAESLRSHILALLESTARDTSLIDQGGPPTCD